MSRHEREESGRVRLSGGGWFYISALLNASTDVAAGADLGQPGARVHLEAIVVPLPHLPAGVPQLIHASLDALAVEVQHKEEDEADEAQDDSQEDVGGVQGQVGARRPLVAAQGQRAQIGRAHV